MFMSLLKQAVDESQLVLCQVTRVAILAYENGRVIMELTGGGLRECTDKYGDVC